MFEMAGRSRSCSTSSSSTPRRRITSACSRSPVPGWSRARWSSPTTCSHTPTRSGPTLLLGRPIDAPQRDRPARSRPRSQRRPVLKLYTRATAERRWSGRDRLVQYRQWRYQRVEACPGTHWGIAIATRRGLAFRAVWPPWSGRKRSTNPTLVTDRRAASPGGPSSSRALTPRREPQQCGSRRAPPVAGAATRGSPSRSAGPPRPHDCAPGRPIRPVDHPRAGDAEHLSQIKRAPRAAPYEPWSQPPRRPSSPRGPTRCGRDAQSIAFLSTPGIEPLYSASRRAAHPLRGFGRAGR